MTDHHAMDNKQRSIAVFGATGSIGVNTLDVIARHPERFTVHCLTAHTNRQLLIEQIEQFKPAVAVLSGSETDSVFTQRVAEVSPQTLVRFGQQALADVAADDSLDTVMAAIVGAAGLPSTLAAVKSGKTVLLANKEALVVAGELMIEAANKSGATLLPIDSEHNAIFQCLPDPRLPETPLHGVAKIILTGSGGPFRQVPIASLSNKTPDEACAHPNWSMGRKISVDSATMMNKGLEVIEACYLFGVSIDDIDVVLHPESVIHSMVSYSDGSVLAQMGQPDMRTPIAHGLAWPERVESGVEPLDWLAVSDLSFEQPDPERYPCIGLAIEAFKRGGTAPATLNAANEVAVGAFLDETISFTDIAEINRQVLAMASVTSHPSLQQLLEADQKARTAAERLINTINEAR